MRRILNPKIGFVLNIDPNRLKALRHPRCACHRSIISHVLPANRLHMRTVRNRRKLRDCSASFCIITSGTADYLFPAIILIRRCNPFGYNSGHAMSECRKLLCPCLLTASRCTSISPNPLLCTGCCFCHSSRIPSVLRMFFHIRNPKCELCRTSCCLQTHIEIAT